MIFKTPESHGCHFLLSFFFSFEERSRKFVLSWKLLLPRKKKILTICWRPFYETSRRLIACIISGIPGVSLIPFPPSLPLIQTSQELCRPSGPVTDNGFPVIRGAWTRKRMDFFPALLMYSVERTQCLQRICETKGCVWRRAWGKGVNQNT